MNRMETLLRQIVEGIIENKDELIVTAKDDGVKTVGGESSITCYIKTSPTDMGRVIGRKGKIATAIRTVMRSAGSIQTPPLRVSVEIEETGANKKAVAK